MNIYAKPITEIKEEGEKRFTLKLWKWSKTFVFKPKPLTEKETLNKFYNDEYNKVYFVKRKEFLEQKAKENAEKKAKQESGFDIFMKDLLRKKE